MNPESIDHAFHAYTGKELDKVPNGPQKDQFESQRNKLFTELQSIKDPREKLQAIASLKADVDAFSGTASGAAAKGRESQTKEESMNSDVSEKMKKFGESLEKSKSESMNRVQLGYKKANEAVRLGNADHIAAQGEANDILRTLS